MRDLKNKRLLLLGGSYCKDAIRQFADEYGVHLIAVGNSPSAGICSISDEFYNVNSTDINAMKDLINQIGVDGVFLGSCEPVISAATTYVRDCGFPCYCTGSQWETLQNKALLKKYFEKFGLPVVPKYDYSYDELDANSENIDFPVITKPADGCGSCGFSVCNNIDELKAGYTLASENSASGQVLIEKFVDNKGMVAFFSFTQGKTVFLGAEDKYPRKYKEGGSYVAGLLLFESRFTKDFSDRYCEKLSAMFEELGLQEGTVWIEIFTDGDKYYFNEAGYRYGGSVTVYPVDYLYGVNQVYADMYYAITGESKLYGHSSLLPDSIPKKKHYCIYPLFAKPGVIGSITGEDVLSECDLIAKVLVNKCVGSRIEPTGDFSQNCALIHFVFDTEDELRNIISHIHNTMKIIDSEGNDQLVDPIDLDECMVVL